MTLTGYAAIEAAEADPSIIICKYNDPTEPAREGLTVEEAREVASEDDGLIYAKAKRAYGSSRIPVETLGDLRLLVTDPRIKPFDDSTPVDPPFNIRLALDDGAVVLTLERLNAECGELLA